MLCLGCNEDLVLRCKSLYFKLYSVICGDFDMSALIDDWYRLDAMVKLLGEVDW